VKVSKPRREHCWRKHCPVEIVSGFSKICN